MTHQEIKEWTAAQDWTLRDIEIARLTGVAYSVVRDRRISAGIPRGKRTLTPRPSKWAGVNWSKSNAEIMAERGVSRQCVSLYRKRFAAQAQAEGAE